MIARLRFPERGKNMLNRPTRTHQRNQPTDAVGRSLAVTAPPISLPKGGAIRGISEKFGANPVTGTGSMMVPIAASPGRSGFGPQLILSYDSGSGKGPFGFGRSLSLPAIVIQADTAVPLADLDTIMKHWFALPTPSDLATRCLTDIPLSQVEANNDIS